MEKKNLDRVATPQRRFFSPHSMVLVALFAVLTAVGAFLRIPLPFVPFTLQFFFCALGGVILGARLGACAQALYVGMGLSGLPVFAGGGGIAALLHPTFGYVLGFVLAAWVVGRLVESGKNPLTFWRVVGATLAGLSVVYLVGVPWLWTMYSWYLNDPKPVSWAVTYGFLIFLGGDLVKTALVALVAHRLGWLREKVYR